MKWSPAGRRKLSDLLQAMRSFLGQNDMMAYLTMMSQRMIELHRVLKPTGSIYLHCDPTASHYLKMLMDAVFGARNFRNEIIWTSYRHSHNKVQRFAPMDDTIMFYTKTENFKWKNINKPYMKGHVEEYFIQVRRGLAYQLLWECTDWFGIREKVNLASLGEASIQPQKVGIGRSRVSL